MLVERAEETASLAALGRLGATLGRAPGRGSSGSTPRRRRSPALAAETGALAGRVAALDARTRGSEQARAAGAFLRQDLGLTLAEFLARLEQAAERRARRSRPPCPGARPPGARLDPAMPEDSAPAPRQTLAMRMAERSRLRAERAERLARLAPAAPGPEPRAPPAPAARPRCRVIASERDAAAALEEFLRSLTQGLNGGLPRLPPAAGQPAGPAAVLRLPAPRRDGPPRAPCDLERLEGVGPGLALGAPPRRHPAISPASPPSSPRRWPPGSAPSAGWCRPGPGSPPRAAGPDAASRPAGSGSRLPIIACNRRRAGFERLTAGNGKSISRLAESRACDPRAQLCGTTLPRWSPRRSASCTMV